MNNAIFINKAIFLFAMLVFLSGCKDTIPEGPAASGPYSLCSYTNDLSAEGYSSARMSYPCELEGPLPAITLTGGYTNLKEQMYWLADHLTKHGYVVITVTPNNILGGVVFWERAHRDAYAMLVEENERVDSPVWQLIDMDKIGMAGYSNGGAGAVEVANELGDAVQAVVGMAPYFSLFSEPDYSNLSADTLLMVGTLDTTAFPSAIRSVHESLMPGATRYYVEFNWATHFEWIAFGRFHNKFKGVILAWLELSLQNSNEYESYLTGEEHQAHIEDQWYREYLY